MRSSCASCAVSALAACDHEFTEAADGITRAYALENDITYRALGVPAGAMEILGGGYAVPLLEQLSWLVDLDVVYWATSKHSASGFLTGWPSARLSPGGTRWW